MKKVIKKLLVGGSSLIGISFLLWLTLLLNPSLSYGHHTDIGIVSVHHNQPLAPEMRAIVEESIKLIEKSELYDTDVSIDLCLSDGNYINSLRRLSNGGVAATLLDNVGIFVEINPSQNHAFWRWEVNDYEFRKWDLTELIAHEMTHSYQYNENILMPIQVEHWKLEGYAEYISRINRSNLKSNILRLIKAEKTEMTGIPWITFEDGTGTSRLYFRNWLLMEYMMTVKNKTYLEVVADETPMDEIKNEMFAWANE